jgi:hypothetical protein
MVYYIGEGFKKIGLKSASKNVKISDKTSIYIFDEVGVESNSKIGDLSALACGVKVFLIPIITQKRYIYNVS